MGQYRGVSTRLDPKTRCNRSTLSHRTMARFARFHILALAVVLAVGCGGEPNAASGSDPPTFDLETARSIIAQQNKQFTAAHVSGDVAVIDTMFLPDARSYPPGAPAAIGIDAIHTLTVDYLKSGITEFREETTALYGNAEQIVDEGTFVLTNGAGITERGKYINVWRQVNGSWRIQANIWNADPQAETLK
ncbi:MAG: nuclear transport factor 2 family protein [Gemmatimonas sp.]|nr:nuclear transport factor 2 family protein [Gemmatimonas sp.]